VIRDMIYEPKGKAAEYAHLALNLFAGCDNACVDCWAPTAMHVPREKFVKCRHRPHLRESVEKYAPNYSGTDKRVHLCFSCDPYPGIKGAAELTRDVLMLLSRNSVPFQILSKSGARGIADFDLYGPDDACAASLTMLNSVDSKKYEPGAALPMERIATLIVAKKRGIHTWASMEPVRNPAQSLELIEIAACAVDLYKLGKLNYVQNNINWREYGRRAIELLKKLNKPYFVKADLAKHLDGIPYKNTDNRTVSQSRAI